MANKTSSKPSNPRRISMKSTKKGGLRATKPRLPKTESPIVEGSDGVEEVLMDRRRDQRRDEAAPQAKASSPAGPQLERRKKVNRRRQIDPTTCERDYTDQEVEFMNALDDYKRKSGRMFPTCSEVLEVLLGLGYVKLSMANLGAMPVDSASTSSAKPMPTTWQGTVASVENANDNPAVECEPQMTY